MREQLRPTMRKELRWKITRIRGNRAELVGMSRASRDGLCWGLRNCAGAVGHSKARAGDTARLSLLARRSS
jgi:hypothetical protein